MIFRSHRGCLYYAPENTMPAFQIALDRGFEQIETDPQLTKDGVVILMHDNAINRTCRNADGSEIAEKIYPPEATYEELMKYDAGIARGEEFRGTKIPTLDELLTACEGKDVEIALDKKIKTENMDPLFDVVAKHNVRVSFSCADLERIKTVLNRFPDAYICYDGEATDEMLTKVCELVRPERLMVWMYLDKPNFHWLEATRKCSTEKCEKSKKYARLGIANVNNPYDLMEAMAFEPDCVEM